MPHDVTHWLSPHEVSTLCSGDYWNNVAVKQQKAWWIVDGDGSACLEYLNSSGLLAQYRQAEEVIAALPTSQLKIADLAAGIGWTTALLSRLKNVSSVHAVEISQHRVGPLFEAAMDLFHADRPKIHHYLGSFYNTQFADEELDVVFMCQAFHHADEPARLLHEIDRILKPTGTVVVVGEHNVTKLKTVKRFLRALSKGQLKARFADLWPSDDVLGDHYYSHAMYRRMFSAVGLAANLVPSPMDTRLIVAQHPRF